MNPSGGDPPLEPGYEIVEHTADFAIAGRGRDLAELFAMMGRGLFALICDVESVQPEVIRTISLPAAPEADLLVGWLQEINGLHHLHREVYSRFQVHLDENGLEAEVAGEPNDVERHSIQHEVKGITWHDLQLEHVAGGWRARVLLDV